jgi:aspartate/methionine/tyrosine aminotransferase
MTAVQTAMQWNPALDALPFSAIRQMFNTAASMKDVLHLSIGQPDFPTPPHIIEAFIAALREGRTRYELDAGLPALREALAESYSRRYRVKLTAANVLVTTGCCQAMYMALSGAVKPGKEVIVVEPVFVLTHIASLAGCKLRRIVTTADNGYQVDPQQVIDAMNDNTCAVMINSPGNPTGTIYPRSTIRAIVEAAAARSISVISDEVYDRLILDGDDYASALDTAPSLDNVIVASSVSKTYSMAGLRLGWAISSPKNIEVLQRYHMYISTTENTPTQYAVLAALRGDQSCVDNMVAQYRARRDRIVELVAKAKPMVGYKPGGAFFIMPSLPRGVDSFDLALRMLKETGVCTIPGGAFGDSCRNALRISYATSMETIEKAFDRITPWLARQSF